LYQNDSRKQASKSALNGRAGNGTVRAMDSILAKAVADSCAAMQTLLKQQATFDKLAAATVQCLKNGGKILTCGNGGSAADALHMAEEFVGRYRGNRRSLPAICLNADPTALTCIANDFGYDEVFARQVEGLGNTGDILVGFTTSGNSPNVLRAFSAAKARGLTTVGLLGKDGGKARGQVDMALVIESSDTARIQEAHTVIIHAVLEVVELAFPA
jgi:D-sedoheptulose 7-phosphate isomerase